MSERTVLVVDDDDGQRKLYQIKLGRLGLKVEEASTEEEALTKMAQSPDVVATDLHLDEEDFNNKHGYRIAKAAKSSGIENVVIASASSTPSENVDGVDIIEKGQLANWVKQKLGL